ncbi:MAG TPA: O-antigen ligase family protein, partial [Bacteroidia bacterium]
MHLLLLSLLAFSIPLHMRIAPVIIGLLLLNWLLGGQWKNKVIRLKDNPFALLLAALYLYYVAGLLWTSNMDSGLQDIETKLSMLVLPLVIVSSPSLSRSAIHTILNGLVAGCVLSMLICIGHSVYSFYDERWQVAHGLLHDTYTNVDFFFSSRLSVFAHPSYMAMFVNLALLYLFYRLLSCGGKALPRAKKLLLVILNACFSVFIFFLASRMGMITLLLSWIGVIVFIVVKRKLFLWGAGTLILLIIGSWFLYTHSAIIASRIDYALETLRSKKLDKTSSESSAVRVLIWEQARKVIMYHPLQGAGTGDAKDELLERYRIEGMSGALEHNLNAHDQYYQTTIALGFPGGILLLLAMFLPVFVPGKRDPLFLFFILLVSLNFLVESMLETQAGVVFFAFFTSLLLAAEYSRRNGPMRIMILTQYFPPEVGAPQNRLYELGVRLARKGAEVTVMTAMPNYPQMQVRDAYRGKVYFFETMEK